MIPSLSPKSYYFNRLPPAFVFTNSNVRELFDSLPRLDSFFLLSDLGHTSMLTTIPLNPSLHISLRRLCLDFGPGRKEKPKLNLEGITNCRALEDFELKGGGSEGEEELDMMLQEGILAIVSSCQRLRALWLYGFSRTQVGTSTAFLQGVVSCETGSLKELYTDLQYHIQDWPLSRTLKGFECTLKHSQDIQPRLSINGWDALRRLRIKLASESTPEVRINCPSLTSLKLSSTPSVELVFVGPHPHLVNLDFEFNCDGVNSDVNMEESLNKIARVIAGLSNLRNLRMSGNPRCKICPSALAGLHALKRIQWDKVPYKQRHQLGLLLGQHWSLRRYMYRSNTATMSAYSRIFTSSFTGIEHLKALEIECTDNYHSSLFRSLKLRLVVVRFVNG